MQEIKFCPFVQTRNVRADYCRTSSLIMTYLLGFGRTKPEKPRAKYAPQIYISLSVAMKVTDKIFDPSLLTSIVN